jgi:hypothetical protein
LQFARRRHATYWTRWAAEDELAGRISSGELWGDAAKDAIFLGDNDIVRKPVVYYGAAYTMFSPCTSFSFLFDWKPFFSSN